jgi:lantibiotic leader peptide-processing serine protease
MRKLTFAVAICALALAVPLTAGASKRDGTTRTYEVLYAKGATASSARAAIKEAGGKISKENRSVGVATVKSSNADFAMDVARTRAVYGAAHNRPVGYAPQAKPRDPFAIERSQDQRNAQRGQGGRATRGSRDGDEPLASHQWDMRMIHATKSGSYGHRDGRGRGVRVGVLDTGVDGSHPDIRGNFNRSLSRNFTTDDPIIDGPCSEDPDGSCNDPNDVDEDSHGTHVAGTIASPLNGRGIGGVAPNAEIVNLRAGQDSGFFFLQPSVDALTYAGRHGIDVVNMSYYIDPWLYNCANNPADTPEQQMEQRTIIAATERALDFARDHGVTLVSALGNENTDLGHPTFDDTSPDYPPDAAYPRDVDNSCVDMPTEAPGVLGISALGPTKRKAYYSDYGLEQNDLSAPGGDRREFFGTPQYGAPDTRILAPYPKNVAEANGDLNPDGTSNNPLVVEDCSKGECAYYQYLQGTSMASPHAVGVAAVTVGKFGERDRRNGGLEMSPSSVERVMKRTATKHACPNPRLFHYDDPELDSSFDAFCEGGKRFNGFYGHGIVDAGRVARR